MKFSLILIVLLIFITCSRELEPTHPNDGGAFGFYFLQDDSITIYNVLDKTLDDLTPLPEPWLSSKDIDFYDFSSHCIYLKKTKSSLFPQYKNTFELLAAMPLKPFWIVAGGEQCYIGAFHSAESSLAAFLPYLDVLSFDYFPEDVLPLRRAWMGVDERDNTVVKKVLQTESLYHAGISVELLDVSIFENHDIATLDYIFQVTNNDVDDLLILDADRMGPERFHYFTNGPVLSNRDLQRTYQSSFKEVIPPEPYDAWDPAWFSVLKSGQHRSWTVRLKGYEKIEPGRYDCTFVFAHPNKIKKKDRYVGSNRYWLGEIKTADISITL